MRFNVSAQADANLLQIIIVHPEPVLIPHGENILLFLESLYVV